jgi:hypothetical protein
VAVTRFRSLVLLLLFLFLSIPAAAQANRISVFGSNGDGYGIAYERRLSRAWSVELAATLQNQADAETYPFDLAAHYSFANQSRWRPYAGLGVRFVSAPTEPRGERYDNQWAPEPVVGVDYNITESWSLRAEAKHTLGNTYRYDDAGKITLGIGWRF